MRQTATSGCRFAEYRGIFIRFVLSNLFDAITKDNVTVIVMKNFTPNNCSN
jgi:hypothetical protein